MDRKLYCKKMLKCNTPKYDDSYLHILHFKSTSCLQLPEKQLRTDLHSCEKSVHEIDGEEEDIAGQVVPDF